MLFMGIIPTVQLIVKRKDRSIFRKPRVFTVTVIAFYVLEEWVIPCDFIISVTYLPKQDCVVATR